MDVHDVLALIDELDAAGAPIDVGSEPDDELDSSDIDALSSSEEELLHGNMVRNDSDNDGAQSSEQSSEQESGDKTEVGAAGRGKLRGRGVRCGQGRGVSGRGGTVRG